MKKYLMIFLNLVVLLLIALAGYSYNESRKPAVISPDVVTLEEYWNKNISVLSPVKESLGGKFYVTKVEAHDGAGTVYYEDGHNSYVADFGYSVDEQGVMRVETFSMRK